MKLSKRYYDKLNNDEAYKMALGMAKLKDDGMRLQDYFALRVTN
nr:hypothetical protein [uncultured Cellulosilyticum sp.]